MRTARCTLRCTLIVAALLGASISSAQDHTPSPPSAADSVMALRTLTFVDPVDAKLPAQQSRERPSDGIDFSRVAWVDDPGLRTRLAPLLGRPIDAALLTEVRETLASWFRESAYPFTLVTLPPQTVDNGEVLVLLSGARVGEIRISNARRFTEESYRDAMRLHPGDPLNAVVLRGDLDRIARNPFRNAQVLTRPGATPGATDIELRVGEARPWRVHAGSSNAGTRSTDTERVSGGVTWGDAFGKAHQLSYQVSASPDFEKSVSHSMSYVAPMRAGHELSASVAYSKIDADIPEPFEQRGESGQVALRYSIDVPNGSPWRSRFHIGFDYKTSDNNLTFASIPVTDVPTETFQWVLSYDAEHGGGNGSLAVDAALVLSPGKISGRNTDAYFEQARSGAEARYGYLTAGLRKEQMLRNGFGLNLNVRGQLATGNLLSSEQMAFGGAWGPRGYDEGEVYGDQGLLFKGELLFPAAQWRTHWLRPLVFVDAGVANVREPLQGESRNVELASAGAGVRYSLGSTITLRGDYGWQIKHTGYGANEEGRAHVSFNVAW